MRVRWDGRAPGIGLLLGATTAAIVLAHRTDWWWALIWLVAVTVIATPLIAVGLPPWRDPDHSPRTAGLIVAGFAVVALIVGVVIRLA